MIRTVNLSSTLRKLSPELSRRPKASHLAGWAGNLLVQDSREKVVLAVNRTRVVVAAPRMTKHAIRGDDHVAQLIIGADDPFETVEAAGMKLSGDAGKLLPVLFPNLHPQLGVPDAF